MSVKETIMKIVIIVIIGLISFFFYWKAVNYIQINKLYPWNPVWLHYEIFQKYAPSNCFVIDDNYLTFNRFDSYLYVGTAFTKYCNFTQAHLWFTVSDADSVYIENPANLTINRTGNLSQKYRLGYIINSKDMELYQRYPFELYFKLNNNFYNFYGFNAEGAKISQIEFIFDNSLNGYKCDDQDCFTVINGKEKVKKEDPIWRGFGKTYRFEDSGQFLIRFGPKSSKWDFVIKLFDTLILGLIAITIYEVINLTILKNINFKNNQQKTTKKFINFKNFLTLIKMKKQENIFIKKVVEFLMVLENAYPEIVSISKLKKDFGKDYERIVKYVHDERDTAKQLITGNKNGWRINNWKLDEVQKLISRSVHEDVVKEQSRFNKIIAITAIMVGLMGLFKFVGVDYREIANKTHNWPQLTFLITVGIFVTIFAGLLTKELIEVYIKK